MDNLYNHPELYHAEHVSAQLDDGQFWQNISEKCRLLELGSGTGRLTQAWHDLGFEVVGIEASEKMRTYCQQHLSPEIEISAQDIADFHFDQTFDMVVMPLNLFNHLLDQEEQIACLNCCKKVLPQGGQIVIDIFNPDCWAPWEEFKVARDFLCQNQSWQRQERHEMSPDKKQFILELKYVNSETKEVLELGTPLRIVRLQEILALVNHCGFEVEQVYGNYDKSDFEIASHHIIVKAKRL